LTNKNGTVSFLNSKQNMQTQKEETQTKQLFSKSLITKIQEKKSNVKDFTVQ
jgi:hypothetical protein